METKKQKQVVILEKKFQHIDLSDFQTACRFILLQQDVKDSKRRWKESGFSAKPALPKLITGGSQAVSFAKQWRDHLKENPHPTSSSTESFINWETIELSDHVRKQKKGKDVVVVDPDVFLRVVCVHHDRSSKQAYLCYLKVAHTQSLEKPKDYSRFLLKNIFS